jgi:hypothetical protein
LRRRGAEEAGIYALMLTDAAKYDAKVHAALREFAINRPGLTINYLEAATRSQFEDTLHELARGRPRTPAVHPRAEGRGSSNCGRTYDPLDELLRVSKPTRNGWNLPGRGSLVTMPVATNLRRPGTSSGVIAQPPTLPRSAAGESIPELKQELYANPGDYAVGYAL